jgi:hypothetical protein
MRSNINAIIHICLDIAFPCIQREKILKRWSRKWKLGLIEAANPGWRGLYDTMIAELSGSSGQARGRRGGTTVQSGSGYGVDNAPFPSPPN